MLACEGIFSRSRFDAIPHSQNYPKNINSVLAKLGNQDTVFTCPSAIIYKLTLPGAMGQAQMSSPA